MYVGTFLCSLQLQWLSGWSKRSWCRGPWSTSSSNCSNGTNLILIREQYFKLKSLFCLSVWPVLPLFGVCTFVSWMEDCAGCLWFLLCGPPFFLAVTAWFLFCFEFLGVGWEQDIHHSPGCPLFRFTAGLFSEELSSHITDRLPHLSFPLRCGPEILISLSGGK